MGEQAYFSASPNGGTCDMLGANWVKAVFHRHTKDRARNRRRLLLVDGHSSHVNLTFLKLCDELKILVLVLPPHTTHRLQPLDVSPFWSMHLSGGKLNRLLIMRWYRQDAPKSAPFELDQDTINREMKCIMAFERGSPFSKKLIDGEVIHAAYADGVLAIVHEKSPKIISFCIKLVPLTH